MGITCINTQIILDATLFANGVIMIKKDIYFLIFSFCVICVNYMTTYPFFGNNNVESKFIKTRHSVKKVAPVFTGKTRKNIGFIHHISSMKYKKKNFFLVRTKNNILFILSHFFDKYMFYFPNELLIVQANKFFGFGKIKFLQRLFCYASTSMSMTVGRFYFFPYAHVRSFQLFHGLKFIDKIEFHPITLVCSTKKLDFYFYSLTRMSKNFEFVGIGVTKRKEILLFSINNLYINNRIFIAILKFNKIETFVLVLNKKKSIQSINICGCIDTISSASILLLEWGGIFSPILFTGDSEGAISLWNTTLFPILTIKNFGFSIKDLQFFESAFSFLAIFNNEIKNLYGKKQNKTCKNTVTSTFKSFIFTKKSAFDFKFIVSLLRYQKSDKMSWCLKKFLNELNTKKNIVLKVKIIQILGKLILLYSDPKFIRLYSKSLFLVDSILKNYLAKKSILTKFKYMKSKTIFFAQIFVISKFRQLTVREIKVEHKKISEYHKISFFYDCVICEKTSRVLYRNLRQKIYCLFSHFQGGKHYDWKNERNFFSDRIVKNDWDFYKKSRVFFETLKFICFNENLNFVSQKEFFGKFAPIYG